MVGPRPDQDHRRVAAGRRRRYRRRLCRRGPQHQAKLERSHRHRARAAGRRCWVRQLAGAGGPADHRYFRRRNGQFRLAADGGARPDSRGRDLDQRSCDPDRGAVARRLLSQQRDRRSRGLCSRRTEFRQLRRCNTEETGARGGRLGAGHLEPQSEQQLRCNKSASARSR